MEEHPPGDTVGVLDGQQSSVGQAESGLLGSGREITLIGLAQLIPLALTYMLATLPLAIGGMMLGPIFGLEAGTGSWLASAAWLASGFLLLVRPVEEHVSSAVFGFRRPTGVEAATVRVAFERVCERASVDPSRFVLRVEDSMDQPAAATGGHMVAITRGSLSLPPAELEAALAHELGHHRGFHGVTTALCWWWSLPSIGALYALRILGKVGAVVGRHLMVSGRRAGCLGFLIILAVVAYVGVLFLSVLIAMIVAFYGCRLTSQLFGRFTEYEADAHAVRLGYGPSLTTMLERDLAKGADTHGGGPLKQVWRTHPLTAKRIRNIERLLVAQAA